MALLVVTYICHPKHSYLIQRIHLGEFPMDCPLHDSRLQVHYKGMLLNEEKTVFYDTRVDNDGQPLEFSSGEGLVSYLLYPKINYWLNDRA